MDLCSFLSCPCCGGVGSPELLGELGPDLGLGLVVVVVVVVVGSGRRPTGRLCALTKYIQFNQFMQYAILDSFTHIFYLKHEISLK